MNKIIICIIIVISAVNTCFAAELELSDVIKDARKTEILKVSQSEKEEQSVQPVKNEKTQIKGEQSACEKINPKEIMQQQTSSNCN